MGKKSSGKLSMDRIVNSWVKTQNKVVERQELGPCQEQRDGHAIKYLYSTIHRFNFIEECLLLNALSKCRNKIVVNISKETNGNFS
jgi:hypothetical protein